VSSDKVLDRLLWDPTLIKEDFLIGHLDRFLGILESSMEQLKNTEIILHRIYYVKHKPSNVIVWDRKAKINRINEFAITN
jgi:uncharacterized protein (UPF0248 family)